MLIEVWSDVVCPFCYVGKRRLDTALEHFEQRDTVDVVYRSFELNPDAPPEWNHAEQLARKYGMTVPEVDSGHEQLAEQARLEDGVEFDFARVRSGSTFDAHQLLHLAREHGVQGELKWLLLRSVFALGRPIGDRETLIELASEVGIDADTARAALAEQRFAAAVREDEATARRLGVNGVPFYFIDGKRPMYGAVPVAELLAAMRAAMGELAYDGRS